MSLAFPVTQVVKNLPAMWETWGQSLGWEDPLDEAMQTPPVFLPGESYGQRSLAGYSPWELERVGHHWATKRSTARRAWRGREKLTGSVLAPLDAGELPPYMGEGRSWAREVA